MEILSTALLVIIFSYLLYISTRRPKNFPPGLRRIPIIGQTFKGSRPVLWLWRRHKIMGHFIGNTPAVTIQDFQLARELLSREEWCGRGQSLVERYLRSDSGVCKVKQSGRLRSPEHFIGRELSPQTARDGWSTGASLSDISRSLDSAGLDLKVLFRRRQRSW